MMIQKHGQIASTEMRQTGTMKAVIMKVEKINRQAEVPSRMLVLGGGRRGGARRRRRGMGGRTAAPSQPGGA